MKERMEHELKTWPEFYADLAAGDKTFELRNDDRHFQVGDTLRLREFDPKTETYSGRETIRTVKHLLRHDPVAGCAATFGLKPGFVILSIF
jgi:uncharacterized protein YqfB (UPF0267 family)